MVKFGQLIDAITRASGVPEGVQSFTEPMRTLDPKVAALCEPISAEDPCGPDLDFQGDPEYLSFAAQVEGILPTAFFSLEDGKPFNSSAVDIEGQIVILQPLLTRSRDIRLLMAQARLLILKRDLKGFTVNVAAIAELLEKFWDTVHPRNQSDNFEARIAAVSALDLTTVIFPLQYAPLVEGRRTGSITYRGWLVASGEVKPREGETVLAAAAITEAIADADPEILAAARNDLTLLNSALNQIRRAFEVHGSSSGLATIPGLVSKMLAFIDPYAVASPAAPAAASAVADSPVQTSADSPSVQAAAGPAPVSMDDAAQALAAIAAYYSHSEPSSPALPLVRQAHQLIGKSFLEVMTILMPSQVEKAAFQIGTDQVFELPVEKLSNFSAVGAPSSDSSHTDVSSDTTISVVSRYRVETRAQATALLDMVQRYFRHSEPSSPVPMLCERARALVERDFMGVLRDVLPKSALKNLNAEK